MSELDKLIQTLDVIIDTYEGSELSGATINGMLKDISPVLYRLESIRAKVHDHYQREIKSLTDAGASAAKAQIEADVKYPQMYQLRRVMQAAYKCQESMRTQISWIKHEMQL